MSKRNKSPKEQCNHLSPTHLSIEIRPTDLPTFSFNWTPRLKRNSIYQRFKDFGFSKCSNNKNIFHDIHLERELEWGCIKEVDNGQTKYDCFHLSQIKDPVPNCNFSLEDCKSTIAPCQYLHPVSFNRTLRFSAVAVIYGFDILGNPETKYCVCDVRNTAPPNQKYCPP